MDVLGLDVPWFVVLGLCLAAFMAGLVDSMAGGGGLIQVPVLFGVLPNINHATLLGTNKISSIVGTLSAALRYSKAVTVPWHAVWPAAIAALLGAFVGAYAVSQISSASMRMVLPVLLILVAIYTYARKDFGLVARVRFSPRKQQCISAVVGLLIGLYDGFFGPGTGSFLLFAFVAIFGFDFLMATAASKWVNVACNLASLLWFAPAGHVLLGLGLLMACFNVLGARIGAAMAIRKGAGFVRQVLLFVVFILILKTSHDVYWPMLKALF